MDDKEKLLSEEVDRQRRMLQKAVDTEVAEQGMARSPWSVYPDDPQSPMWRMGPPEWHLMIWHAWWESKARDEEARIQFFRSQHPPAAWLAWVASLVWPDLYLDPEDYEEAEVEGVRRLEQHGLGTVEAWQRSKDDGDEDSWS